MASAPREELGHVASVAPQELAGEVVEGEPRYHRVHLGSRLAQRGAAARVFRPLDVDGQAVAELREAVMPPSVISRLGLHPKAATYTEAWGEEVYQLGVLRHPTFNPGRRTPVIALRLSLIHI